MPNRSRNISITYSRKFCPGHWGNSDEEARSHCPLGTYGPGQASAEQDPLGESCSGNLEGLPHIFVPQFPPYKMETAMLPVSRGCHEE